MNTLLIFIIIALIFILALCLMIKSWLREYPIWEEQEFNRLNAEYNAEEEKSIKNAQEELKDKK